jgi:hypothetical protein
MSQVTISLSWVKKHSFWSTLRARGKCATPRAWNFDQKLCCFTQDKDISSPWALHAADEYHGRSQQTRLPARGRALLIIARVIYMGYPPDGGRRALAGGGRRPPRRDRPGGDRP